ncbi:hypothetical protein IE077_001228 [Cardiosporidium cionae]|uniref:Xylulose kinase n=1 Tax=Cardiosporidium cionae TaxID=476202 RepID=A0ABQ7JDG1_9APIC|nr:hypothetical protein IE077_001228 [Cardiosporidium cionae]|eukprot:KAF8822011.1 hypothetical protein IE077_001228 [Cardiosporidium cionae]
MNSVDTQFYVGFDLSTQSIKVCILSAPPLFKLLALHKIEFDEISALSSRKYGTTDGIHRGRPIAVNSLLLNQTEAREENAGANVEFGDERVTQPVLMFIECMFLVLQKLYHEGWDLSKVAAISGSAQQHGSIYWTPLASTLLDAVINQSKDYSSAHLSEKDGTRAGPSDSISTEIFDLSQLQNNLDARNFTLTQPNLLNASNNEACAYKDVENIVKDGVDPVGSLVSALKPAFTILDVPIWMDTSTSKECIDMEATLGGAYKICELTGSRCYERFTGPHIHQIVLKRPNVHRYCSRVTLISNFAATLLSGVFTPTDCGDGSGMNIMNIHTKFLEDSVMRYYAKVVLQNRSHFNVLADSTNASGSDASLFNEENVTTEVSKIITLLGGNPILSSSVIGNIGKYWQDSFKFSPSCQIVSWSGDNLCSAVGLGLLQDGDMMISLGTSDTLLTAVSKPKLAINGHYFAHPIIKDGYLFMLCYTNGALNRKFVRDKYTNSKTWEEFSRCVEETPVGCNDHMGFYMTTNECTPPISNAFGGEKKIKLCDGNAYCEVASSEDMFASVKTNCRAILEQRALSMRSHLESFYPSLFDSNVERGKLIITGGGSQNAAFRQIFADVFQRQIICMDTAEAAVVGAAYRAFHGVATDKAKALTEIMSSVEARYLVHEKPRKQYASSYDKLCAFYAKWEKELTVKYGRF